MKKAVLLALLLALLLTGCGAGSLSAENADGTVTVLSYESAPLLRGGPSFRVRGRTLYMHSQNITWYRAVIIDREAREQYGEEDLIAYSSNLMVYASKSDAFEYIYILDLEGTDESFVRFRTVAGPSEPSMGSDFAACVTYVTDGVETVPDLAGLTLCMQSP